MKLLPGKERRQMKSGLAVATLIFAGLATGCKTHGPEAMGNLSQPLDLSSFYMPNAEASRIVTVTTNGRARANILVQTHAVSVKENASPKALKQFGEVYSFSPAFFAVHRDEPTLIRFWNLQPDDNHDFMLIDPHSRVLMSQLLPPLKETSFVFTFHEEGLFTMICAMHRPSMNAQILVLPPTAP
jgi:plastocyanin